jgi:hypothetical protein
MADAQAVLDYLRSNLNNNVMRIDPFFGDGTQDPLTWYTAFTKARKSNGWERAKSFQMFAAHLQDEADDWWSTYVTANGEDYSTQDYRWMQNVEPAF